MKHQSDYEDYERGEGELTEKGKLIALLIGFTVIFVAYLSYCYIFPI